MTQYETELKAVRDKGGDVKAFQADWHKRACKAYREEIRTEHDIHRFRCGDIKIK